MGSLTKKLSNKSGNTMVTFWSKASECDDI